jgi:hypothetical protein
MVANLEVVVEQPVVGYPEYLDGWIRSLDGG